ncbi:sensor histidine kinase N-terminal domain-containing protein [Fertoebacter nigrum]|uniref:histidine kinase n=1 Tax=Fertoeibacter niger TaxID=2656921 RepID=A0A8X8KPB0_9RHOB|nr:sensor histidine kinase [Fertoeibacter niger]NUB45875.1 sensor histidine kinase N-terminal domain-containing protein [Fertoeibacter niger]
MTRAAAPAPGRPLWRTLALWMLPILLFLMVASLMLSMKTLREVADSAYDRSLRGAIRAIDLRISTESGGLGVELPYPLFESFQATAEGEVLFRVSTDDGLVQIGDALLPAPPPLTVGQVVFYDAIYFNRPIRVGAYMRPLDPPLYGAVGQNLIIEIAETTESREAFLRTVISRTMLRDLAALLAAALLLAVGVHAGLRPLRALRDRLDLRASDDLRQMDPAGLPREVQPLVRSVNRLVDRHRIQGEAQRRYIEDASHQLKTPLAVLRAQIDRGLQLNDPEALHGVLRAMREITDRSSHLTSQLLALALARNSALWSGSAAEEVDLSALLDGVVRLHLPSARKRRIVLEVDAPADAGAVHATEALLFEAVSNLLQNAITASPAGGVIVMSVQNDAEQTVIAVRDEGPGVSDDLLRRLDQGLRFNLPRTRPSWSASTGLGLAIVQEIMATMGGRLVLANRAPGGLLASLHLPKKHAGLKAG